MKKTTVLLVVFLMTKLSYGQIAATGTWEPIDNTLLKLVTNDPDLTDGASDGALFIDGQSPAVGQGVKYTFNGTMKNGESYTINTNVYNTNASYVRFIVSLYDLTANVPLATAAATTLNSGNSTVQTATIALSYTTTAAVVGHALQLRYVRNDDGATSRNFNIDNVSFNGTPLLSKTTLKQFKN
jgi:hypothetical protein